MAKYSGPKSTATLEKDAMQIALSIQRPEQTKEQTRLIARGIEIGIKQYKRREKAKLKRSPGKQKKPGCAPAPEPATRSPERVAETRSAEVTRSQPSSIQRWLPWMLLALTWLGIGGYFLQDRF